jgi:CBS domain containing-hemolysin-like protein
MNDAGPSRQPRESGASHDDSLFDALKGWMRLFRKRNPDSLREAIDELIEEHEDEEAPIEDSERNLLSNILNLRDITAVDVMVPRIDIVAVDSKTSASDLVKAFVAEGHSRMPVYRDTLDDVIGMIHIKDLLAAMAAERPIVLARMVRRLLFVSPSTRVLDLLLEMRIKRTHMALVVDEYGGIDGLITIEDLVEEIVGEIDDEHDREEQPDLMLHPDGTIEADARTPVEEFEEMVGSRVLSEDEREDLDTVGGLVFSLAGRVPSPGERILHPAGLEFEVLDADPRRVKRLRVRRQVMPAGGEAS